MTRDGSILRIYGLAIVLGLITGTVGSLFQLAIQGLDKVIALVIALAPGNSALGALFSVVISLTLVFLAWYLVTRFAPEAAGSGVQEIEGALLHERPVYWKRLIPVKFIGAVMAISSKMVLGREGPTIQLGANLGDMLGDLSGCDRSRRDTLIAAGAAAGLATAFNAPLAAVLFIMEEMRSQFNFSFTNFKTVAITCVMATIALHAILGDGPAIPMAVFETPGLNSLWLFFIFGIFAGFAGLLFNLGLMRLLYYTDMLSARTKLIYVLIVGGGVGYLAYVYSPIVGGGYEIIQEALNLSPSIIFLGSMLVLRFFTTLICYSTGVPGGIFAPLLALGTLAGCLFAHLLQNFIPEAGAHPAMFAVAGMGALFSASIRAPITGIILVVEMTQNYSLILPLMVSCLTSTTIVQLAGSEPIYTQLLRRTMSNSKDENG